jgi:hypothetical protein
MSRFIHDQFAKDYLEELLSPLGEVTPARTIRGEQREIDVWFVPKEDMTVNRDNLGLLGHLAATASLFEPFRNPANPNEICNCLLKSLEVRGGFQRQTNRNKTQFNEDDLPKLWILTPTASERILEGFGAKPNETYGKGIYFFPLYFRTAFVVIHQLPETPETLWLRILGKGNVQQRAINELEALPLDHPLRANALELLFSLRVKLEETQENDQEDRDLIMRLSPLYLERLSQATESGIQQGLERGVQQGLQQGERLVVENLLKVRFGQLDDQLSAIIEPVLRLSPEEFTPLLLNLSREQLLERFGNN